MKHREEIAETMQEDQKEQVVQDMIRSIGEDPQRKGLRGTPRRVVESWKEIFAGYNTTPDDLLKQFDLEGYSQIVLLRDIELYSMCEHHILPFWGKAHIAYIPNGKVVGISKLARLLEVYSRRLQIQERIGEQVTKSIMEYLDALGAACVIEAQHLCMKMRGVVKQHSMMVTSSMKGVFLTDPSARAELLKLIG